MRYDYKCDDCDTALEITKPMSESSKEENCPKCGKVLRRMYNPLATTWHDNCWDYDQEGLGDNFQLRHHW